MARLDFFAAGDDQIAILDFLFAETDIRVFELASEYGQSLKEFASVREIQAHCTLGMDVTGSGSALLFQLWSPTVEAAPVIQRIDLDPRKCQGHTFRYNMEGWGLLQLYFGGVHEKHEKVITKSHFGHNTQKRADGYGATQGVDWAALARLSSRIQYHIRKKLAVARVPGCPVLRQALSLTEQGYALKLAARTPWQYEILA